METNKLTLVKETSMAGEVYFNVLLNEQVVRCFMGDQESEARAFYDSYTAPRGKVELLAERTLDSITEDLPATATTNAGAQMVSISGTAGEVLSFID
jgi:hypothetical protein